MALSVLPALFQNLNFLIQKEFGLLWGVDKEMKRLWSTLSTIQSVIEDAEEKQFRDKEIRDWLQKLKYAAYELDDILDDCSTETLKWEYKNQSSGSPNKQVITALSVLPALFQNLNFLIQKEFRLLWGVDKEIKKLSSTLSAIQSVIEDAEEKQFRDKEIQDWLQKLKYAAYELDDIFDDCL
ncbi:hypothetical protein U1Q18_031616 [Sarracenia purpurea var. burkii]